MVHTIYDIHKPHVHFFDGQIGSGEEYFSGLKFQRGYGRRMYGHGVFGLVGKALRYIMPHIAPLAKTAASALLNTGADAGAKILQDIARGEDAKASFATHGGEALKKIARNTGKKISQMGSGRRLRKRSVSNLRVVGRSVLKSAAKKRRRVQNKIGLY